LGRVHCFWFGNQLDIVNCKFVGGSGLSKFHEITECEEINMNPSFVRIFWTKIVFVLLFAAAASTASIAQTDVEIEIAGPWSYVQDPADSSRIVVVVPDVGHTMAVFMGDNPFVYLGATQLTQPTLGSHRLDFATVSCGSTAVSSSYFLYPANGVSAQNIKTVLSSTSAYSISLPKPCSYESALESHLKYNGTKPVTGNDADRSFTTWMTLHYKVGSTTTGAVLDQGTPKATSTTFGSNTSSNKKAISIIVHLDVAPDTDCDSHSATAFDTTLKLWNLRPVFRAFPQLIDLINSNQQLATYCYSCAQTSTGSTTHCTIPSAGGKRNPMAPGRADCHAPQVNVNGVVN
jgi:hypothetical protein